MVKKSEKEKGITMVALVVTIIILIILAGVSINMTLGENGIIKKAQEAKRQQVISETKEKIRMEILEAQIDAMERDEEIKQEQIRDIIANYGELQEDGETIVIKDTNYKIDLSEIYTDKTTTEGNEAEYKEKIALLEAKIEELKQQLEELTTRDENKTIYQVSIGIINTAYSSNGEIIMPNSESYKSVPGGKAIAGFVSEKVTLIENSKLTLPKGKYTFESMVPTRSQAYGTGYKVFTSNGQLLVDHTYATTTSIFATSNFNLEETTDIMIYWHRTHAGWTDLTYYRIKDGGIS